MDGSENRLVLDEVFLLLGELPFRFPLRSADFSSTEQALVTRIASPVELSAAARTGGACSRIRKS